MSELKKPHPALVLVLLVLIQVIFGMNYVVSKVVVDAFSPLLWASVRLIIAAIVMMSIAMAFRPSKVGMRLGLTGALPLSIFALLGIVINQAAFLVGLHYTTPSNSAILNTLTPIFTLLIVTAKGQERLDIRKAVGFSFAFLGVLVLRRVENFSLSDKTAFGDLLVLVNCISFSLFITFSKGFVEKHDPFWTTAWLFVYGAVGMTALAIPDWLRFQWPEMTSTLWWCVGFALICGTLMTYYLNNWTLKYAKSSHVALFIYVQPVVTMIVAYLWLHETVTHRSLLSCSMIFIGLVLAISRRGAPRTVSSAQ